MKTFAELLLSNRTHLISAVYDKWISQRDKVLDVGCGDGIITQSISTRFNVKISGCDIDKYLIREIPFSKVTSEDKLPFPNKSFDTVMFNDVLHHTSKNNQEKLICEAIRVTRKNILIFELNTSPLNYIADFVINKIYHPSMKVPCTFRNKKEWCNLFDTFPIKLMSKDVSRPILSPFTHIAFCLSKR